MQHTLINIITADFKLLLLRVALPPNAAQILVGVLMVLRLSVLVEN